MTTEVEDVVIESEHHSAKYGIPYEDATITVFVGLRGAGKTCKLAEVAMMSLALWGRPTYSDIPFGGYLCGKYYVTEPLPNNIFVTYAKGVPRGSVIVVDELQEFFDRQDWMTVQSKMGTSAFAQIRKLGLIIFGATQFFTDLNPRIARQVDYLLECQDLHYTPWGRDNDVPKGHVSLQRWYDLSGRHGKSARSKLNPHMIDGEPYRQTIMNARALWEYFNTLKLTALNQRFQKFQIEREVHKVGGNGQVKGNGNGHRPEVLQFIADYLNDKYEAGQTKVRPNQIVTDALTQEGIDMNYRELGNAARALGVEIKRIGGTVYYIASPIGTDAS